MKTTLRCLAILLLTAVLAGLMPPTLGVSLAEIEIDLGDDEAATPTPAPAPKKEAVKSVDVEEEAEEGDDEATYSEEEQEAKEVKVDEEEAAPTPTPASRVVDVKGMMKMKDYYEAGIKSYKAKDYQQAIRYLQKAVVTEDPYTKDYYYAEANAMLGVIYQFYFTVPGNRAKAYSYYKEALRIDPQTRTARKYISQVRP